MQNMKTIVMRIALLAGVGLLATGWTDCDNFSPVVVPATDTSLPITFEGVYQTSEYVDGTVDQPMTYHLAPGERAFAVGAGIDAGGLRKLTMFTSQRYTCCRGSLCTSTVSSSVPQSETQAGGTGSTVSNGIYLYNYVVMPNCGTGSTLRSFSHGWFVVAEDFKGNSRTSRGSAMVYP